MNLIKQREKERDESAKGDREIKQRFYTLKLQNKSIADWSWTAERGSSARCTNVQGGSMEEDIACCEALCFSDSNQDVLRTLDLLRSLSPLELILNKASAKRTIITNRMTQAKPGQIKLTQVKPGHVKLTQAKPGQIKLTQAKPGQIKLTQVKPGQVKLTQAKPGQVKLTQAKPGQIKLTQAKPGQIKLTQAKPGQIKLTQAKPGQIKLTHPYSLFMTIMK